MKTCSGKTIIVASMNLLLVFIFPYSTAQSESDWIYANGDETIKVYYQTLPSGNVVFKGVTTFDTNVESLLLLFSDIDNMKNWIYRTEKVVRLKQVSDSEGYIYSIHTMPFPFKDRDSVLLSIIEKDPETKAVTIHGKGKPHYIPETTEYVRIQYVESFWNFYPLGNGQVRITFQGYGEPGGSIPTSIYRSKVFQWLVEMYLWRLPYTTLFNMREELIKDKYNRKVEPDQKN